MYMFLGMISVLAFLIFSVISIISILKPKLRNKKLYIALPLTFIMLCTFAVLDSNNNEAINTSSKQLASSAKKTPKVEEKTTTTTKSANMSSAKVVAPKPVQKVAPEQTNSGTMVWLSATGKSYHSINNCGRMNPDKATQVTLEEAKNGHSPCSKCGPPQ